MDDKHWFKDEFGRIKMCRLKMMSTKAEMATVMAEKIGIALAYPSHEDRAGRQAYQLLPPREVALRACEIADAMWEEFERREWLSDIPMPDVPKRRFTGTGDV